MIVDGRAIAALIYKEVENEVSHMRTKPHLTVFTCAPNFETQKYLKLKKRKAHNAGIAMNVVEFQSDISTQDVVRAVAHAPMQTNGIIVQLPFPPHIDIDAVLNAIPKSCDVDAVHYDGTSALVLPPVIGAIKEISDRFDVLFAAQRVVIVGKGRLVGAPAHVWCQKQGAQVTVVTEKTPDAAEIIQQASIVILGAGKPGLVTPDMIHDRAVVFDAGTSEEGGVLRGDADPACASKAALFTPVPGGIGPITVAVLLRNLISLTSLQ